MNEVTEQHTKVPIGDCAYISVCRLVENIDNDFLDVFIQYNGKSEINLIRCKWIVMDKNRYKQIFRYGI